MTPKKEWCEHIDGTYIHTFFDKPFLFCPICGTPRPKPLTKQERLAQYLYEEYAGRGGESNLFDAERPMQAHYMELSGKVINWLKEDK